MERRFVSCPVKIEERVGSDYPYLVGLASVFYREDDPQGTSFDIFGDGDVIERVMPGAFDRALREMDCAALFNHSPDQVLGRKSAGTLRLGVTELGLQYEITAPQTQLGRDLGVSIKRGDITGSSFSFIPRKYRNIPQMNGKIIRELHDVDLYDVGPVTFPAYAATTAGVRALGDMAELKKQIAAQTREEGLYLHADALQARARAMEISALYSF